MNNNYKQKKPKVSLISNCLNRENREFLRLRNGFLCSGVLNPFEFSYKVTNGIIPIIDIIPDELFTTSGMKNARNCFIRAVEFSVDSGAEVVLLAASTKRLFGNGDELKTMFPETIFTIGDNGTALAFIKQIEYLTSHISVHQPVMIIGAGFLGEVAFNYLSDKGFEKIIIISRHKLKFLKPFSQFCSIDNYLHSNKVAEVALILGCAHTHQITAQHLLDLNNDRIFVLDVAVPKALPLSVISQLNGKIIRFDAGDFYIQDLKLHFPHYLAGLSFEGEFYGCFTEALVLSTTENIKQYDFFKVSETNMKFIRSIIQTYNKDFHISLRNFGKPIAGFSEKLAV